MSVRHVVLQDLVRDHLRQTLSGVNKITGVSTYKEWIYTDQPRIDAKKPRIAVEIAGIPDRPLEEGNSKGRISNPTVAIDIYTDSQFIYSFVGRQYSGTLLRDHLADKIYSELVFSKSSLWISASLGDVRETGGTLFPYNENDDIYHRQVRYSFEIIQ